MHAASEVLVDHIEIASQQFRLHTAFNKLKVSFPLAFTYQTDLSFCSPTLIKVHRKIVAPFNILYRSECSFIEHEHAFIISTNK